MKDTVEVEDRDRFTVITGERKARVKEKLHVKERKMVAEFSGTRQN